jgi:hypothetical protein
MTSQEAWQNLKDRFEDSNLDNIFISREEYEAIKSDQGAGIIFNMMAQTGEMPPDVEELLDNHDKDIADNLKAFHNKFDSNPLLYWDITFENCESVKIEADAIKHFLISNFPDVPDDRTYNIEVKTDEIYLKFNDLESLYFESFIDPKESLINRLQKYQDITSIDIHHKKCVDKIVLPWSGTDYHNDCQNLTKGHDGFWRLMIKDKTK